MKNEKIPVYGSGKNIRDWIYVKDHVSALLKIMEKNILNKNFVIGSRNERTNIEIIKKICAISDKNSKSKNKSASLITFVDDRLGHDFRYSINPKSIEKSIDWSPEHDFSQSINETFNWYLQNKSWWEKFIN